MNPFPEKWELISAFESEPNLTDADVPWAYNRLTFSKQIDGERLECTIEPGYETLSLRWERRKRMALSGQSW